MTGGCLQHSLRGLLVLLVLPGGGAGAGIVVQLAYQRYELADAAAAREAIYFIGRSRGAKRHVLTVDDFHDGEKNIVLDAAQAAFLQRGETVRKRGVVIHDCY